MPIEKTFDEPKTKFELLKVWKYQLLTPR